MRLAAAWFFAGVSATCFALFAYPYLIYPALLRMLSARPVRPSPTQISVSLLFCAYNEAGSIGAKLDNLRALKQRHPELQILAYDDGSIDGTGDMLVGAGELLTLVRGPGRTGKAAGMKRLAQAATGDILIFTDANVLLAPDAIERLLPYYGDPDIGGVCGTLRYSSDASSATAEVGSLYWRIDERLRTLESDTGNVMGADGSIFSIRRSLYPEFPDTVLDDMTVSMSVIFQGKRLIKAPDVVAYENSVADRREELRRKIRIGARAYHTHAFLRAGLRRMSRRDRFKYGSRKLLRWFGGLFVGGALLFGVLAVAMISPAAAGLAAGLTIGVAIASTRARGGMLARAADAVMAVFATFIGVVQGMRGRTMATWTPAKSR